MAINTEVVKKVAHLARIKFAPEDLEPMAGELNRIIDFVEQLNEVDTRGVEPMARVVTMALPLRDDIVTDGDKRVHVLLNAPERDLAGNNGRYFVVPKVVE